jgi:hypothetical protein
MPTVLIFSRHTPENCPLNNEKMKKMSFEFTAKLEEIAKKNGVRIIGNWAVMPEHLTIARARSPYTGLSTETPEGTLYVEMVRP